jgi:hypothetical protein
VIIFHRYPVLDVVRCSVDELIGALIKIRKDREINKV